MVNSRPQALCPICRKPADLSLDNRWRPFCSQRCRLIDLGEWLDESRRIPGQSAPMPPEANDDE